MGYLRLNMQMRTGGNVKKNRSHAWGGRRNFHSVFAPKSCLAEKLQSQDTGIIVAQGLGRVDLGKKSSNAKF
jgi:hypothetical protein